MSELAQVPRLHVSTLDKAFPLTEAPLCLRCKEPTQREEVQRQGPNQGRWRYACQTCVKRYGRMTETFCSWDDDFGIDVRHPLCRCDLPSREGHCGYGSRAPGKIFMTCAVGKCSYQFWPGIYVDDIGGSTQALLSCTCSVLPAKFQPASGGTVAIVYDEYCPLHGIPVQVPQTPKRGTRVNEQPITPKPTPHRQVNPTERSHENQDIRKLFSTKSTPSKAATLLTMAEWKLQTPLGKRPARTDAAEEGNDGEHEESPSKKPFKVAIFKHNA